MPRTPVSEEDEKILQIVGELCQRLDIPDYKPRRVVWRTTLPHDQTVALRDRVSLSTSMKSMLGSEDWRLLIATELIYRKKLRTRVILGFWAIVASMIGVSAVLFVALPILLPTVVTTYGRYGGPYTGPQGVFLALALAPLLLTLGTLFLDVAFVRMVRLQADVYTAKIFGKEPFLSVLNKIVAFDASKPRPRRRRRPVRPSLDRRIASLQKL
jgi:hypothetical protein